MCLLHPSNLMVFYRIYEIRQQLTKCDYNCDCRIVSAAGVLASSVPCSITRTVKHVKKSFPSAFIQPFRFFFCLWLRPTFLFYFIFIAIRSSRSYFCIRSKHRLIIVIFCSNRVMVEKSCFSAMRGQIVCYKQWAGNFLFD